MYEMTPRTAVITYLCSKYCSDMIVLVSVYIMGLTLFGVRSFVCPSCTTACR